MGILNFVLLISLSMNNIQLTAVYEPCEEGGYIAYIREIEGINSQGETLEEAKENLADAINLMFEENRNSYKVGRLLNTNKSITQILNITL
jgi:predicted RNase H-like HicB family nuclease